MPRRRAVSDSGSDYSDRSCKSECESDGGYADATETGRGNIGGKTDGQNRPHGFMGDRRRDEARRPRWGDQDRRARTEYEPCAACGAPRHSVHRCFRRYKFCTQQFKRTRPPTVTGLGIDGLPQLSEPAVEANFVFAFVKRSEWQEDINAKDFGCEQDGGSCPVEESIIMKPSEEVGELTGVITSAAKHVPGSPNDALDVPPGSVVEFKLQRNCPSWITHDLWVRRTNSLYRDWQVLAFAATTDGQLSDKERLLYEEWLAQQPPAVERRQYAAPGGVRSRPLDAPHGPTCEEQWKQLDELTGTDDGTENGVIDEVSSNQADSSISEAANASSCPIDAGEHEDPSTIMLDPSWSEAPFLDGMGGVTEPVYVTVAGLQKMDDEITDSTIDDPLADLHLRYVASADALINDMDGGNDDEFEYEGNEIHFEDYAHELAILPDLTVPTSTILDYDAPNVKNPTLDPIAQLKLVETLR
ncbi:unnamed protein product [Phytophthora fragariaefolia]|uniref:Unnamed protein product n=1 Tax=Phytophthora fragariaefolia TaxID=1490495 RepID=A0A9W6Y4E7_9STRA|nr:unnamed protein product [Phytophthora fragariaefolia]